MVFSRHRCEKCLEYMRAEKTNEGYILKCPNCERACEKWEED